MHALISSGATWMRAAVGQLWPVSTLGQGAPVVVDWRPVLTVWSGDAAFGQALSTGDSLSRPY